MLSCQKYVLFLCPHLCVDGPGAELEVHVEAAGDGEAVEDGHQPVQYRTVQYSTVQCGSVQYSVVQYSTV